MPFNISVLLCVCIMYLMCFCVCFFIKVSPATFTRCWPESISGRVEHTPRPATVKKTSHVAPDTGITSFCLLTIMSEDNLQLYDEDESESESDSEPEEEPELTIEDFKKHRTNRKRALTREINLITQLLAECNLDTIPSHVNTLKERFRHFKQAADTYADALTEDADIDASENYFDEMQRKYIETLNYAKTSTDQSVVADPQSPIALASSTQRSISEDTSLINMLHLPRVVLEIFDGNALHWHQFIKSFDMNVGKICDDPDVCLTRLIQYTSGSAKEAIRGCLLLGGEAGYRQARSILESRFGNKHLVTQRIIKDLKEGKTIRSSADCQQLADDIKNAYLILNQLGTLNEVDSQAVILEVICRFPNFVQIKWKKFALDTKHRSSQYPSFKGLVDFVEIRALEFNDPFYGNVFPRKPDTSKSGKFHSSVNMVQSGAGSQGTPLLGVASNRAATDQAVKYN